MSYEGDISTSLQHIADGAQGAIDGLKDQGYAVKEIKNTFQDGAPYKGVNVKMTTPEGQPFELQFHTQQSFEVKQATHGLYEQARLLPDGSAEQLALDAKQVEMSAEIPNPPGLDGLHK